MAITSQLSFVRSLVRISIVQILKSIGFNKSANYLIDILTDLYVRYFELLLEKTTRLSQLRQDDEIIIQDISLAIDELLLVRPSNMLDVYDIDLINDNYCHIMEHWCFGDTPDRARDLSKPNLKYIRNKRLEDLQNKLNRVGLGGLINSNTYEFSSKTKEEIELEKLLNDEIIINVPEDYLQYLLTNQDTYTKNNLKSTFLNDEIYDKYANFITDDDEIENENENNEKIESEPEYIINGPTPESLQGFLPYDKNDHWEFDLNKYLQDKNKNLLKYQSNNEIEFHDDNHDLDDKGLQLGEW